MNSFSMRLKDLRQESGLSQGELSTKLNIPRTTISAWELGNRQADTLSINALCDFFNVSADYLLGRIDIRNPIEVTSLNNNLSNLMTIYPDFNNFINKIMINKDLQLLCKQITCLSDVSLPKLFKIAKILDEE